MPMDILADALTPQGAACLLGIAALPLLLRSMVASLLLGSTGPGLFSADGLAMVAAAAFAANSVGALDARTLRDAASLAALSPSSFSLDGAVRSMERDFRTAARALEAAGG